MVFIHGGSTSCAVAGCRSTVKDRKERTGISFHKFPKDVAVKRKWVERCGRVDNKFDPERSIICSNHFLESDFTRTDRHVARCINDPHPSIFKMTRLNAGAIPSRQLSVVISDDEEEPEICNDIIEITDDIKTEDDSDPDDDSQDDITIIENPIFLKEEIMKLPLNLDQSSIASEEAIGPCDLDQEISNMDGHQMSVFKPLSGSLSPFYQHSDSGGAVRVYSGGILKKRLQSREEDGTRKRSKPELEDTSNISSPLTSESNDSNSSDAPRFVLPNGSSLPVVISDSHCNPATSSPLVTSFRNSFALNSCSLGVNSCDVEINKIDPTDSSPLTVLHGNATNEKQSCCGQSSDVDMEIRPIMRSDKKQMVYFFERPPDVTKNYPSNIFPLNLNLTYPTDRGNFQSLYPDPFLKMAIINYGSCKPQGPFPRDDKNRSFSLDYYWKKTLKGQKLPRSWLCYSQKADYAYCEPCWLFSEKLLGSRDTGWSKGINDWQGLSKKIKDHEVSQTHMLACITFDSWKNRTAVETLQEPQWKERISLWNDILKRVVDLVSILSMSSSVLINFKQPDINNRRLKIIDTLAANDKVLNVLVQKQKNLCNSNLNYAIQSELVDSLSRQVKDSLINDIKESQFYSVILHYFNSSGRDIVALVFRYVVMEYYEGSPTDLYTAECFAGFFPIFEDPDKSASEILEFFETNGISLNHCRGISYGGGKSVRDIYTRIYKRIVKCGMKVYYIHCAEHKLDSIMKEAVKIPEIETYYSYIRRIRLYFRKPSRWALLEKCQKSMNQLFDLKLPKWKSDYDAISNIHSNYSSFMKTLQRIILMSNIEEVKEAKYLNEYMRSFQFILITIVQYTILKATHPLSDSLLSNTDLLIVTETMRTAFYSLAAFRNLYSETFQKAETLADCWASSDRFVYSDTGAVSDLARDRRLEDPKERFRIEVYEASLDSVLHQLSDSYNSMQHVVRNFDFLRPSRLVELSENDLHVLSYSLSQTFPNDLSVDFSHQMISFRNILIHELETIKTKDVFEVAKLLIYQHSALLPSLPDVSSALRLFLTLPVTLAKVNSVSKFTLITNFVNSPLADCGSSALCTIGIESEKTRKVDIASIVDSIAEKAVRNGKFLNSFLEQPSFQKESDPNFIYLKTMFRRSDES